jgi:hypothetical protein
MKNGRSSIDESEEKKSLVGGKRRDKIGDNEEIAFRREGRGAGCMEPQAPPLTAAFETESRKRNR